MNENPIEQQNKSVTPGTSISGIAAALLILFFFTPWFSACNSLQVSGVDLATGGSEQSAWWLFGIPLVGLAVIAIAVSNIIQSPSSLARRAAATLLLSFYPLLALVLLYVQFRDSLSEVPFDMGSLFRFEFGFYGTLLATIAMIGGAVLDWAAGKSSSARPQALQNHPKYAESHPPPSATPVQPSPPSSAPPVSEAASSVIRPRAWLQGQSGSYEWQALELTKDITRIGSNQQSEIYLPEPNVAAQQAIVRYGRGQYYLQNQSDSGSVLLNGEAVDASTLQDNDVITIGNTRLRFRQL